MVFVIVLLSLAVQGTLLPAVSRKLEMIDKNANVMRTFNDYQDENDISFVKIKITDNHPFAGKTLKENRNAAGSFSGTAVSGDRRQ
mgnify:CR=1 FL=1